jgi:hypothetical protein
MTPGSQTRPDLVVADAMGTASPSPGPRNRFIQLEGAVKSANRDLEEKARTLAGGTSGAPTAIRSGTYRLGVACYKDPVCVSKLGPALVTCINAGNGYECYFSTRADACRKVPSCPGGGGKQALAGCSCHPNQK